MKGILSPRYLIPAAVSVGVAIGISLLPETRRGVRERAMALVAAHNAGLGNDPTRQSYIKQREFLMARLKEIGFLPKKPKTTVEAFGYNLAYRHTQLPNYIFTERDDILQAIEASMQEGENNGLALSQTVADFIKSKLRYSMLTAVECYPGWSALHQKIQENLHRRTTQKVYDLIGVSRGLNHEERKKRAQEMVAEESGEADYETMVENAYRKIFEHTGDIFSPPGKYAFSEVEIRGIETALQQFLNEHPQYTNAKKLLEKLASAPENTEKAQILQTKEHLAIIMAHIKDEVDLFVTQNMPETPVEIATVLKQGVGVCRDFSDIFYRICEAYCEKHNIPCHPLVVQTKNHVKNGIFVGGKIIWFDITRYIDGGALWDADESPENQKKLQEEIGKYPWFSFDFHTNEGVNLAGA